jgi:hypothetical protein
MTIEGDMTRLLHKSYSNVHDANRAYLIGWLYPDTQVDSNLHFGPGGYPNTEEVRRAFEMGKRDRKER